MEVCSAGRQRGDRSGSRCCAKRSSSRNPRQRSLPPPEAEGASFQLRSSKMVVAIPVSRRSSPQLSKSYLAPSHPLRKPVVDTQNSKPVLRELFVPIMIVAGPKPRTSSPNHGHSSQKALRKWQITQSGLARSRVSPISIPSGFQVQRVVVPPRGDSSGASPVIPAHRCLP